MRVDDNVESPFFKFKYTSVVQEYCDFHIEQLSCQIHFESLKDSIIIRNNNRRRNTPLPHLFLNSILKAMGSSDICSLFFSRHREEQVGEYFIIHFSVFKIIFCDL